MPTVREVIEKVEEVGLTVRPNPAKGGHTLYDIVDRNGVILTGISGSAGTGGDPNWHWHIRRLLRHAGYKIEFRHIKPGIRPSKQVPARIDLAALKAAQEKAASRGERIPTLEDLDNSTEFFSRLKQETGKLAFPTLVVEKSRLLHEHGIDAEESYSTFMDKLGYNEESKVKAADAPRTNSTKRRLEKFLGDRGDELVDAGKKAKREAGITHIGKTTPIGEFVKVAMLEVAPKRNLRNWTTPASGTTTVGKFLKGELNPGLWAINLIEATLDHFEGLQWGVVGTEIPDEAIDSTAKLLADNEASRQKEIEAALAKTQAALEVPIPTVVEVSVPIESEMLVAEPTLLDRYTDILLLALATQVQNNEPLDEGILNRLDKLTGLS